MFMVNQKKLQQVEKLTQLIEKHPNFALIKYGNTSHQALEKLRKELGASDAKLNVVKISLFEKAVNKLSLTHKQLKELVKKVFPLRETSALLTLGEDYFKGLGAFAKFAKNEQALGFKFGLLDKKIYLAEEIEKIAQIPGKDELIARIIGSLKSSQYKLVSAMKFNVTKLTLVLKERAKQN